MGFTGAMGAWMEEERVERGWRTGHLLQAHDALLERAAHEQAVHVDGTRLAQAVRAVHRLQCTQHSTSRSQWARPHRGHGLMCTDMYT